MTAAAVKERARSLGFDLCGVARAEAFPEADRFDEWLDRGYAGSMAYLSRSRERRRDLRAVLPSVRSVIVTGTVYHADRPYPIEHDDPGVARIARYAWGDDYHTVIARRLEALLAWLRQTADVAFDARIYVDTGPVLEKVVARHAGLGWIGKNSCLINPRLGSWVFLGEILCSLDLEADEPVSDHCGSCTRCLEGCPTGALAEPYVLDATRCISYLTIELRDSIPEALREAVGSQVYGCDICQDVCPWNRDPAVTLDPAWQPREGLDRPRLAELWSKEDDELRALVRGSAMTRAKLTGLRRNLAVALGNSRSDEAAAALARSTDRAVVERSPSLDDPMVREHIVWAQRRVTDAAEKAPDGRRGCGMRGPR